MKTPENIFFVGPMGAGKTTVGRQLAKALGKEFYDCDREIEKTTGADIPLIFELEGEEGFRKREQNMLAELTENTNVVIATGGGAVLAKENRANLVSRGFVIYLRAPLEFLVKRTSRDRHRPLLQTENPRERLEEIIAEREPLYKQVADMTVTTDQRSIKLVVKDILKRLSAL